MRRLLSPSWLLLHVACLAVAYLFIRLGLWQWQRARAPTGMPYNYIYALQWWGFTIFGLVLWGRTVLDELHPRREATAAERMDLAALAQRPLTTEELAAQEADDAELADYNRYLASLNGARNAGGDRRDAPVAPWRARARPAP